MRWIVGLLVACGPGVGQLADTGQAPVPAPTVPDTTTDPPTGPTGTTPPVADARDYRLPGPYTVDIREGSTTTSCEMGWTRFEPNGMEPKALVVMAHGWARSRAQTAGWGAHWASWGLAVVTPDLCHASLLDVDHEQNGADLVALAAGLGTGLPVIYAGHSAGGLAGLLAAAQDPATLAELGLDLVDADGLGVAAGDHVGAPAAGLIGDPSACNTDNNAGAVYAEVPGSVVLHVVGAGHCDFENPTDWACEAFCDGGSGDDVAVSEAITALSTAWLLWRSDTEPGAAAWFDPGSAWYQGLVDSGALAAP